MTIQHANEINIILPRDRFVSDTAVGLGGLDPDRVPRPNL